MFCRLLAERLLDVLSNLYSKYEPHQYEYVQAQVGQRRLRAAVLNLLAFNDHLANNIEELFDCSNNMTDTLTALKAAQTCDAELFARLMEKFEHRWQGDGLVLDKWFGLHATQSSETILSTLSLLRQHPQFKDDNPNRVRALIGSFAFYNVDGFHAADGSGYRYVADYLLDLDKVNPQVAARIITPLTQWQGYNFEHQQLMKSQLSGILNQQNLSKDVFEKVSKSLAYDE